MVTNYKVTRTFHPVGQGAFYSERHTYTQDGVEQCFNIVYDCGSRSSTRVKNVVVKAFTKEDTIDILFISHFDLDHVSLISKLRESVKKIDYVVMPLLENEHKNFLINVNRAVGNRILSLFNNPARFFGKEAKVISVKSTDNKNGDSSKDTKSKEGNDNYFNEEPLPGIKPLRELKKEDQIESGVPLSLNSDSPWVFIPYNYLHRERAGQLIQELTHLLKKELKDESFTLNQLKKNPNFTIDCVKDYRKTIKAAYNKLNGDINENSMLVYSGPSSTTKQGCHKISLKHRCLGCYFIESACIYTGDTDLNKVTLDSIAPPLNHHVGTIQIPHHGSQKSFNLKKLKGFSDKFKKHLICPLSAGTNSGYNHPDPNVMNALLTSGFTKPFVISEDTTTTYQQTFVI
jgi:beta-lactamase superfamily II metal-dependent hydrolase